MSEPEPEASQSEHYGNKNRLVSHLSLVVRKKVFAIYYERFGDKSKILDVGVTSENQAAEANFFEKLYPHKEHITAVGIEDAQNLEKEIPGVKFQKIQPNQRLPFEDNSFDVVFCHAVIEHVIGTEERRFFISELTRVAPFVFLTTPNQNFPIETHTKVPFLHMAWPSLFYSSLDKGWFHPFYRTENLNLFTKLSFERMLFEQENISFSVKPVRLFGLVSNWIAVLELSNNSSGRSMI